MRLVNLRFALLAILSAAPRTGYDLLQIFDASVGFVWHAPHTQIYPELRRMEAEGLLASTEIPRGPKASKREYRITDAGLAELRRLASTPVEPPREKDAYRLKAAYLEFADPDGARAQFELHIAHYEHCWRSGARPPRPSAPASIRWSTNAWRTDPRRSTSSRWPRRCSPTRG